MQEVRTSYIAGSSPPHPPKTMAHRSTCVLARRVRSPRRRQRKVGLIHEKNTSRGGAHHGRCGQPDGDHHVHRLADHGDRLTQG